MYFTPLPVPDFAGKEGTSGYSDPCRLQHPEEIYTTSGYVFCVAAADLCLELLSQGIFGLLLRLRENWSIKLDIHGHLQKSADL